MESDIILRKQHLNSGFDFLFTQVSVYKCIQGLFYFSFCKGRCFHIQGELLN